ncbi:MAG: hypothetical protein ACJAVI_006070 [Candidatus Azotimanducaceae bacterium]|jgi:hypothetical protein
MFTAKEPILWFGFLSIDESFVFALKAASERSHVKRMEKKQRFLLQTKTKSAQATSLLT